MGTLVVISGDRRGESYPLGRRTNVIGRAESLPIQVLDDHVSRKHLQIRFESRMSAYIATDMSSRNGVYVNSVRIVTETTLADRDRIRIGNTLLLFIACETAVDAPSLHRFKQTGESLRVTQADEQSGTHRDIHPRWMPEATIACGA